jgi:hypothetical protein
MERAGKGEGLDIMDWWRKDIEKEPRSPRQRGNLIDFTLLWTT